MISVIIVNYHCAELSLRAVTSVLDQHLDSEILLVDNSHCSREAERLREGLPKAARLLVSDDNLGFGRACNQAYAQAKGEFILLLNPDAWLHPGCLRQLLQCIESDARIGAVGPKLFWDQERRYLLPPSIHPEPWQRLWHSLAARYPAVRQLYSQHFRRQAVKLWQSQQPVRVPALSGGLALLRRSALACAGGLFDPVFFMYYEDSDLFWRLRQAGYWLMYEAQAEASHAYEHHAGKMQMMAETAPRYYSKHFANAWQTRLAEHLAAPQSDQTLGGCIDLGLLTDPLRLNVPADLQSSWLLEISPSPWLVPAIGQFGTGEGAEIASQCWPLLKAGRYFCRLGSTQGHGRSGLVWQWEKQD